jgi:hypothetical protein
MRDDELIAWAESIDVALPSGFWGTLSVCNDILSPEEQRAIMEAALLLRLGRDIDAEQMRVHGGYGYHDRKKDRQRRGLPIHIPRTEGAA